MFAYKTSGVCATEIHVDIKDNVIENVEFVRGCPGNLFGIAALVKGMNVDEAIEKLEGIDKQEEKHAICVYCGQCVQACPTGALVPKREAEKLKKEVTENTNGRAEITLLEKLDYIDKQ